MATAAHQAHIVDGTRGCTVDVVAVADGPGRRRYRRFVSSVYADDPHYRRVNEPFREDFLGRQDRYARRCFVRPVLVSDGGRPLVAAILVASDDSPVLRISFPEFTPDADAALRCLVAYATNLARARGLTTLSIGINGQISYGFGILEHDGSARPEFNSTYNPAYYTPVLDGLEFSKTLAHAYAYTVAELEARREDDVLATLAKTYTYRALDRRRWRDETLLFGELCDRTLAGTPHYSPKSAAEMADTIAPLRWIIGPADIIFAFQGAEPVGVVYIHPDYAENLAGPRTGSIGLAIAARRRPSTTMIADFVGVLPGHRRSGLSLGLLYEALRRNRSWATQIRSTFVMDANQPSRQLTSSRARGTHRTYALYEKEL